MSSHLFKCLEEEEEFTFFLRSNKHLKLSTAYIIYIYFYYICRNPFYEEDSERDENLFQAECANCGEWYHKTFLICFNELKCRIEMYEILERNIKIKKEKKDFLISG